jgi:hypothetical protein
VSRPHLTRSPHLSSRRFRRVGFPLFLFFRCLSPSSTCSSISTLCPLLSCPPSMQVRPPRHPAWPRQRRPPPHSQVRPRRHPPSHSHVWPRRPFRRHVRPWLLPHSPVRLRRLPHRHVRPRRLATLTPSRRTSAAVVAVHRFVLALSPRPITPSSSTGILDTSTRWSPDAWQVSSGPLIA